MNVVSTLNKNVDFTLKIGLWFLLNKTVLSLKMVSTMNKTLVFSSKKMVVFTLKKTVISTSNKTSCYLK